MLQNWGAGLKDEVLYGAYTVIIWYFVLTPIDRKHRSGSKGMRLASATRDHTDPLGKLVLPISSTSVSAGLEHLA